MARSALVVDDSKSARFALQRYLERYAFSVDTAESAEVAYTYLRSHRPEVIFLDHVMPGVDGFDVLRSIKSDPRTNDIPVVICSSNEGDAFTQEARFKGAADVLPKPPSPQQLARVLGSLEKMAAHGRSAGMPAAAAAGGQAVAFTAAAPGGTGPSALEQLEARLMKSLQEIAAELAGIKTLLAQKESGGPMHRLRTRLARGGTPPSAPRPLPPRRKLPRR